MTTKESDRELLALAAKAAGIDIKWNEKYEIFYFDPCPQSIGDKFWWNPIHDDGDAFRLAVKLNLEIRFHLAGEPGVSATCVADMRLPVMRQPWGKDKDAATRRAVVLVAAAIGKEK